MADTSTEVAIATVTASGGESVLTFSSIPQTYTDLRVVLTLSQNTASDLKIRYNGSGGTAYSWTYFTSYGSGVSSSNTINASAAEIAGAYNVLSTTTQALVIVDISNYSSSSVYKTHLSTCSNDKNGTGDITRYSGLWRSTSQITEINLGQFSSALFAAGSSATLYGIL